MSKNTKLLSYFEEKEQSIQLAAEALKTGQIVVFPTETVYGIGANAFDDNAVRGIFDAKGRPQDNPLIVHVANIQQIEALVTDFNDTAKKLAEKFWPGPLTIIMPKSDKVSDLVSAGRKDIGIRIPSHPVARALLIAAGVPIAAPSANVSGKPSPTTAQHCYNDLNGKVDIILDGGSSEVGLESTIISLVDSVPTLLRPGGITLEQLENAIGKVRVSPNVLKALEEGEPAVSPGMKHKHYAPKAKTILIHGNKKQFVDYCNNSSEKNLWAMAFEDEIALLKIPAVSYGSMNSPEEQAFKLFSVLREIDSKDQVSTIYIHAPISLGIGLAIYNRLLRAADFNEIKL